MPFSLSRTVVPHLVALTLLAGCATEQNYRQARCQVFESGYEITLSGKRGSLSHSLIRAMVEQTYEATQTFHAPRVSGVVDGADVPSEKGSYKYGGTLEFTGKILNVNLHYIDTDRNQLLPLSWNGAYSLIECGARTH